MIIIKKHRKEPSNKHVQQWGKYLKTDEDLRLTTEYTHNVQVKIWTTALSLKIPVKKLLKLWPTQTQRNLHYKKKLCIRTFLTIE